jgi:hypothetical protein
LEVPLDYKIYPYKFNAQWLNDKDFVDLVFKVWKDPIFLFEGGKQKQIVWKLKEMKKHTKRWYKEKVTRNKSKMNVLEADIKDLIKYLIGDPSNQGAKLSL